MVSAPGASTIDIVILALLGVVGLGVLVSVALKGLRCLRLRKYEQIELCSFDDLDGCELEHPAVLVPIPRRRCQIEWVDLELSTRLGKGAFGTVYRAVWRNSDVAVKVMSGTACIDMKNEEFVKEVTVMAEMSHPNVVSFIGYGLHHSTDGLEPTPFLVTEIMERGTLREVLNEFKDKLPDFGLRFRFAANIAAGMSYLHTQEPPMLHRDLKAENCLVAADGTVKVADFGTASRPGGIYESKSAATATRFTQTLGVDTTEWMAPEVIEGRFGIAAYGKPVDVYSFGIIMYEIGTSLMPFHDVANPIQVSFFWSEANVPPIWLGGCCQHLISS